HLDPTCPYSTIASAAVARPSAIRSRLRPVARAHRGVAAVHTAVAESAPRKPDYVGLFMRAVTMPGLNPGTSRVRPQQQFPDHNLAFADEGQDTGCHLGEVRDGQDPQTQDHQKRHDVTVE